MSHARRLAATCLAGALAILVAVSAPALADELDDQRRAAEERSAATDRELEALEASIEGLDARLGQAVLDLQATQARLPAAQTELASARSALETAQREAVLIGTRLQDAQDQQAALTSSIADTAAQTEKVRNAVGEMARRAYKGQTASTGLGVVVGTETTEDFVDQYEMVSTGLRTQSRVLDDLRQLQAVDSNSRSRLSAVRDRVAELKAEADAKVGEADRARAQAQARQEEIEQLIAKQAADKAVVESMKGEAQAQELEAQAQLAAIEDELAGIIAAQRAAAEEQAAREAAAAQAAAAAREAAAAAEAAQRRSAGGPAPAPAPPPAPAAPPPAALPPSGSVSGAMFANPTSIRPAYVTSEYGMRMHPILGYVRLHAGIDLRTYCNTPLYAPRAGTVQWAEWRNGFGNQVMIDYGYINGNSVMSSSNHLTRTVVRAGQRVAQGELIGYAGNTGLSGACHLHFEVYVNGKTVNPRPLLGL
ncbi:M23 family metallopeptidase [uncultured Cellulomonas sp.]|uniref:M23 family metallopeptidase n=1 Tax=uncultured Cellulomonas sp. TaxID=189682 RepID=UPI00262BF598|nr:M23 family metallopeptidase [uncultured Cellulomonas sp.]